MNKDFLRSATLLIAVNLLIKPLYIFGIDRTLQNVVGTAEYGIYFALFNYTLFGQVLLDFGINNFNNRAIAQQHHLLTSYLPTFLRLKVLLALAYMGSCFVGAVVGLQPTSATIIVLVGIKPNIGIVWGFFSV